MNIRKKQKKSVALIIFVLAVALCVFALIFYWYSKGNEATDDSGTAESQARSEINYSPATEEQKNGGESAKKDLANQDGTVSTEEVSVELSAFKKTNGAVRVTTNIRGLLASNGKCELTVSKDGDIRKKQSNIVAVTDYSTCEGFDVSGLAKGIWQVQVNVVSGSKSSSATTTVEV